MKDASLEPIAPEGEGAVAPTSVDAATRHGLVPAHVIAQCVTRGLEAHQRIGQGRREARHGRRKKP